MKALRILIAALVLAQLAGPVRVWADPAPVAAPGAGVGSAIGGILNPNTPSSIAEEDEPTLPWLLGRLEGRFEILAAGHQLLRDLYDIDRVVGNPWELEPETAAAVSYLPYRARLIFARIAMQNLDNDNKDGIFLEQVQGHAGDGRTVMRIELGDDGSKALTDGIKDTILGGLTPDQLIDLGIYLISKASFFPTTPGGWKNLKKQIVLYDVYLALAVVAAGLSANEGRLGFSGWIVKSDAKDFRLGWYLTGRHLGLAFKPTGTAGLRIRSHDFDATLGVAASGRGGEKLAVEAAFSERWWARLLHDSTGWDWRGAIRGRWVVDHEDPKLNNTGRVSGEAMLRRQNVLDFARADITVGGSIGVNTHGRVSGGLTGVLESAHASWFLAVTADLDSDGLSQYQGHDFRAAAFFGGQTESRFKMARSAVASVADRIRNDLVQIDRHRQAYRMSTSRETTHHNEYWLAIDLANLERHLTEYEKDVRAYDLIRAKGEASSQSLGLSDSELTDARRALVK